MIALIKKLWEIAWDPWEHCNGILHETQNMVLTAETRMLDHMVMVLRLLMDGVNGNGQDSILARFLLVESSGVLENA
jgi:hypothetical protein